MALALLPLYNSLVLLMYVDESGDTGMVNSPTRYFALTGIVIHETRWRSHLEAIIAFRRRLRVAFKLKLREEFHAGAFINKPGAVKRIPRHERLAMIRYFIDEIVKLRDVRIINIIVDKQGKPEGYQVFDHAWRALIQRFENTIKAKNFPVMSRGEETGTIVCDHTQDENLRKLLRKMRRFNPIPNQQQHGAGSRDMPLGTIVEDPNFRESHHSFFVQMADVACFLLYQRQDPCKYFKKKGATKYFDKLKAGGVLLLVAAPREPHGIVRL